MKAPDPVGLSHYHGSANTVLCCGIIVSLVFGAYNWLPVWGGFLLGAVPTFFLAALAHAIHGAIQ